MVITPKEKNLVVWNTQDLDTYHDIIVSFDYARYATSSEPTGGFALVFFESNLEVPNMGGPGSALGYTPSKEKDYCYRNGHTGFSGGFLAAGFDTNGEFGLSGSEVNGLTRGILNSISIRSSESLKYEHIATSKNLLFTSKKFFIDEKIQDESEIRFKTVRVILSNACTSVKVQIKYEDEVEFLTVLEAKIPVRVRTAVRAAVTNTMLASDTQFILKNFNVAGFPGVVTDPELTDCLQTTSLFNNIPGKSFVSGNDFCAVPVLNGVNIYRLIDNRFNLTQSFRGNIEKPVLIGGSDNFLFVSEENTYNVHVYYKISKNFIKTQIINIQQDTQDINNITEIPYPSCAHADNRTLVIGNDNSVFVYRYSTSLSRFGLFKYEQTINPTISGNIGYDVQISGDNLLTGGGMPRLTGRIDSYVAFYEYNGLFFPIDTPTQFITSPLTGNRYNEFGKCIQLLGNEAVISSPNEFRRRRNTPGHGEVFHYVFARKKLNSTSTSKKGREWRPAMELGSFNNLNTPAGNFGTSISLRGNTLIVSAPYEAFKTYEDSTIEDKFNVGRVYIFRKTKGGTFAQAAIITPNFFRSKTNMNFGRYVGLVGSKSAVVGIPYKDEELLGEIDFYKVGCIFDLPPEHIEVSEDVISLYDSAGFNNTIETYDYMQLLNYDKGLFSLSSSTYQIIPGGSVTITLRTQRVNDGASLPYKITGIQQSDLRNGDINGAFIIKDNTAKIKLDLTNILSPTSRLITVNLADNSIEPVNITIFAI